MCSADSAQAFFGMNIKNPTPQDFSGLSQLANSSLASLSNATFNQTAAILTALDASSSRNWDLKYYWIWVMPFLFTISLVLAAGGILRWAIQSAAKYAEYWRVAAYFVGPIICVGFFWALPALGGSLGIKTYMVLNTCLLIFIYWWLFRLGEHWRASVPFYIAAMLSMLVDSFAGPFTRFRILGLLPWAFLWWKWSMRHRSS